MDSICLHHVRAIGVKKNVCENGITIEITFWENKPMMEIVSFELGEDEPVKVLVETDLLTSREPVEYRRKNTYGRLPLDKDMK